MHQGDATLPRVPLQHGTGDGSGVVVHSTTTLRGQGGGGSGSAVKHTCPSLSRDEWIRVTVVVVVWAVYAIAAMFCASSRAALLNPACAALPLCAHSANLMRAELRRALQTWGRSAQY